MQERLKALKDRSEMTVKEISKKSGIPEPTISRILSGQTEDPYFSNVCAIVVAMGGSVDEIIGIKDDKPKEQPHNQQITDLYERTLVHERKVNKTLSIALAIILLIIILVLIYDLIHRNAGFIQY